MADRKVLGLASSTVLHISADHVVFDGACGPRATRMTAANCHGVESAAMPERIKPTYDFGPCTLNRASIERLTEQIASALPSAVFAAEEGIWEIYDERRSPFMKALKSRKRLDAFRATAEDSSSGRTRAVHLAFTATEASLRSTLEPTDDGWLEHLIIDLRKALLRPSLAQRLAIVAREGRAGGGGYLLAATFNLAIDYVTTPRRAPYARIVLDEPEPNAFLENIKANLVSNLIWLLLGIAATFLVQWLARNYDLDLTFFKR